MLKKNKIQMVDEESHSVYFLKMGIYYICVCNGNFVNLEMKLVEFERQLREENWRLKEWLEKRRFGLDFRFFLCYKLENLFIYLFILGFGMNIETSKFFPQGHFCVSLSRFLFLFLFWWVRF